jgi:hypothetical protein
MSNEYYAAAASARALAAPSGTIHEEVDRAPTPTTSSILKSGFRQVQQGRKVHFFPYCNGITSQETRPYTSKEDKSALFYSTDDQIRSRNESYDHIQEYYNLVNTGVINCLSAFPGDEPPGRTSPMKLMRPLTNEESDIVIEATKDIGPLTQILASQDADSVQRLPGKKRRVQSVHEYDTSVVESVVNENELNTLDQIPMTTMSATTITTITAATATTTTDTITASAPTPTVCAAASNTTTTPEETTTSDATITINKNASQSGGESIVVRKRCRCRLVNELVSSLGDYWMPPTGRRVSSLDGRYWKPSAGGLVSSLDGDYWKRPAGRERRSQLVK